MGSISAAAKNLGITQPALSARLKKQEEELGAQIFDREQNPLRLTEAGKAFMEYADGLEALQRKLEQRVSELDSLESGRLVIGAATFFNVTYVPRALAEFSKNYPGVDVEAIDGTVSEVSAAALRGEVDLFITPICNDTVDFAYEEMLTEKMFLCVPAQWDINDQLPDDCGKGYAVLREEDYGKLAECTFVTLREGQNIGQMMAKLFSKYSFTPKRTITAEQTLTALGFTRAGVGISLVAENAVLRGMPDDAVKLYLADEEICTRKLYAAYPKTGYVSRATKEFVALLKQYAHQSRQ